MESNFLLKPEANPDRTNLNQFQKRCCAYLIVLFFSQQWCVRK